MSDTSPVSAAQLAKGALKRMALAQQEPTPEHYRQAYEAECQALGLPAPAAPATLPQNGSLGTTSDDGPRWAELIGRINRGMERGHRQWTTARKKDSLNRVLEGSRNSAERLMHRLSQLVSSWDTDPSDAPPSAQPPVADSPDGGISTAAAQARPSAAPALPSRVEVAATAGALPDTTPLIPSNDAARWVAHTLRGPLDAALPRQDPSADEALSALDEALERACPPDGVPPEDGKAALALACEQSRRVIEHRQHLMDQYLGLCRSLADSLTDLAEDDSWAQGQCIAMRAELDEGLGARGARRIHQLLEDTRQRQQALRQEREAARQALKGLIHEMLNELTALGQTTGRFHDNLAQYADTIGQADSLESLAGVVREMVEESRTVHDVVAQTQQRLHTEHTRATELTERVRELEDEIRKLSDEVSTDPLTQIANRRGMARTFEQEQARLQRSGGCLAIGLLDVDNFKRLNDTLGHHTGDEALKFLARRVAHHLRPHDALARYGGEEFVVMLPDTDVHEAQQVLTRVQRALSAEFFTQDQQNVFITFSAGVTQYRAGEALEVALDRADVALYEAKRTGKNRTCVS